MAKIVDNPVKEDFLEHLTTLSFADAMIEERRAQLPFKSDEPKVQFKDTFDGFPIGNLPSVSLVFSLAEDLSKLSNSSNISSDSPMSENTYTSEDIYTRSFKNAAAKIMSGTAFLACGLALSTFGIHMTESAIEVSANMQSWTIGDVGAAIFYGTTFAIFPLVYGLSRVKDSLQMFHDVFMGVNK